METNEEPDWYQTLRDFKQNENQFLTNQKEEFFEQFDDDGKLDELRESYEIQFEERRTETQYRKKALTTVMGGFLNHPDSMGLVYQETGWEFWELDPFEDLDGVTGDILLAKPDQGKTIVVLLLPERETPESAVRKSKEGIQLVRDNLSRFDFPASTGGVGSAIVVNPPRSDETKNAIEAEGDGLSSIFVWNVYERDDGDDNDSDTKCLNTIPI